MDKGGEGCPKTRGSTRSQVKCKKSGCSHGMTKFLQTEVYNVLGGKAASSNIKREFRWGRNEWTGEKSSSKGVGSRKQEGGKKKGGLVFVRRDSNEKGGETLKRRKKSCARAKEGISSTRGREEYTSQKRRKKR